MKIIIVIHALDIGGAERVAVNLAHGFAFSGHEVWVATYRKDVSDYYELDQNIHRLWVDFETSGRQKIKNLKNLFRSIKPDFVVSFINKTNVRCLMAGLFQSWKTIVTEHNDPAQQPIEKKWDLLRQMLYLFSWKVVGVSSGVTDYFKFLPKKKKMVIPNAFMEHSYRKNNTENSHTVIAMGRLVPIKGYDMLISAFAQLPETVNSWTLEIWGEGELEAALKEQIHSLGLEKRILLKGSTLKPFEVLARGDFFVCSSRSEGFGNVLVEAMSVGIPVLSFDCPSGPREIIRHGINGILVENASVDALKQGMLTLMSDQELRKALAKQAFLDSDQYSQTQVMARWNKLIKE